MLQMKQKNDQETSKSVFPEIKLLLEPLSSINFWYNWLSCFGSIEVASFCL